jgi:hypothetical protein
MLYRKPLEERIADRQAKLRPMKEGAHFEHGPAKFIFITLLAILALAHIVGFALLIP